MDYCYGCMRKRDANETVCPVCGYRHEVESWPAFALRPGTLLHNGKYLIGKVLGQGGFGISYLGLDTALELKVAIKEYYPMNQVNRSSMTDDVLWHSASDGGSSGRESFLKEARRMAKVNAIPGIVQVKDIFYQKNTAYIVMNFIEGETLKEKLLRYGAMTPEECVRTLTPVMEALEQAHQSGLIHRDISPDNIMIDQKGKLWVLDMGAAKDLDSAKGPTQSSQAVTKRGFSPPEQSIGSGRGKIGPWTDVYAMCATIYYCLTGRLVPEAMERLLNDELSFPASIPDEMASTLRRGLALRAEERIQSMEKLLQELNEEIAEKEQEEKAKQKPGPGKETVHETAYSRGKELITVRYGKYTCVNGRQAKYEYTNYPDCLEATKLSKFLCHPNGGALVGAVIGILLMGIGVVIYNAADHQSQGIDTVLMIIGFVFFLGGSLIVPALFRRFKISDKVYEKKTGRKPEYQDKPTS